MHTVFVDRNFYVNNDDAAIVMFAEIVSVNRDENIPFYVFSKCNNRSTFKVSTKKELKFIIEKLSNNFNGYILEISNDLSSTTKMLCINFFRSRKKTVKEGYFYVYVENKISDNDIEQIKYLLKDSGTKKYAKISYTKDCLNIVSSDNIDEFDRFIEDNDMVLSFCDYNKKSNCTTVSSVFVINKFLNMIGNIFNQDFIYKCFTDKKYFEEFDVSLNNFVLKNNKTLAYQTFSNVSEDNLYALDDIEDEEYYDDEEDMQYYIEDGFYDDDYEYYYNNEDDNISRKEKLIIKIFNEIETSRKNYVIVRTNEYTTLISDLNEIVDLLIESYGYNAYIVECVSTYILVEF